MAERGEEVHAASRLVQKAQSEIRDAREIAELLEIQAQELESISKGNVGPATVRGVMLSPTVSGRPGLSVPVIQLLCD